MGQMRTWSPYRLILVAGCPKIEAGKIMDSAASTSAVTGDGICEAHPDQPMCSRSLRRLGGG
jgi:hypothetical protein